MKSGSKLKGFFGALFGWVSLSELVLIAVLVGCIFFNMRNAQAADRPSIIELGSRVPVVVEVYVSSSAKETFVREFKSVGGRVIENYRYDGQPQRQVKNWYKCIVHALDQGPVSRITYECIKPGKITYEPVTIEIGKSTNPVEIVRAIKNLTDRASVTESKKSS